METTMKLTATDREALSKYIEHVSLDLVLAATVAPSLHLRHAQTRLAYFAAEIGNPKLAAEIEARRDSQASAA
jgi:hypothetical protein